MSTNRRFYKPIVATNVTVNSILVSNGSLAASFNSNTIGNIFTASGNVGIGITNPGTALDINGIIRTTSNSENVVFSVTGGTYLYCNSVAINNTLGYSRIGVYNMNGGGAQSIVLQPPGPGGSVGIGTTGPASTLDVNGSMRATGLLTSNWTPIHQLINTSSINNPGILSMLAPNASTTSWISSYIGQTMGNGNVAQLSFYYAGNNSTSNGLQLGFYGGGGSTLYLGNNGNTGIGTSSPTSKLDIVGGGCRITGGGLNATFNSNTIGNIFTTGGNLGVNTTTPAYTLDVNGTAKINTTRGVLIGTSNDIDNSRLISALSSGMITGGTNFITFGQNNSTNNQAELGFNYVLSGNTANSLTVGLFGAERMRIQGGGNVGIGTTAPVSLLQVTGVVTANGYNTRNGSTTVTTSATTLLQISDGTTIGASGFIVVRWSNGKILAFFDNGGNLATRSITNIVSVSTTGTITLSLTGTLVTNIAAAAGTGSITVSWYVTYLTSPTSDNSGGSGP